MNSSGYKQVVVEDTFLVIFKIMEIFNIVVITKLWSEFKEPWKLNW